MSSMFGRELASPHAVMSDLLDQLHGVVDELLEVDPAALTDTAVVASLKELERAARRLPAIRHGLVREIDTRGIAASRHVRSTAAFLQMIVNVTPAEGATWVYQASEQRHRTSLSTGERLDPELPAVAAAVRAGALSPDQVQVISRAMRQVPAAVSREARTALEADLVAHAAQFDARPLQRLANRGLDCLDPDGKPTPAEVAARTGLTFGRVRRDGLTPFRGLADHETRVALEAALAPLAVPRDADHAIDTRARPQRLIEALRDLALRGLASGSLPSLAGMPATLLLSTTLEQLEARTGLVSVLNGGTVPVAEVIRLAGLMRVVPLVFSSTGRVLYCGQEQRLFTLPIRQATAAQDRGCVIPGCEVPIPFCQLHHLTDWVDGGPTDVDNAAWLCSFHHHRIDGWRLERIDGRVHCTAPPWLDPSGTPKINSYFHLHDQPPADLFSGTRSWPAAAPGNAAKQAAVADGAAANASSSDGPAVPHGKIAERAGHASAGNDPPSLDLFTLHF